MPRLFSANVLCALLFVATLGPTQVVAATNSVETLSFQVPKRFDLSHVQSNLYAVALGKDPARMFAFVRDQVSYESYIGCLRGPRGTLLAMAGNSVDQAALLASLLRASGETVRYARGKLSVPDAKSLVESMWTERAKVTKADEPAEPSPELQAALDTWTQGVKRDYGLIRDHLKKAGHKPNSDVVISLDTLIEEAQDHWWVQWRQGDRWVDLDPLFSDAAIGSQYATVQDSHDSLPENIFHRLEMRIKLEEYEILRQGNAAVTPTSREILNYKAKSSDLSGTDIVLSHLPEHWTGPATSIQGAIASAIKETGRVKPVVIIGNDKWESGAPFRQREPAQAGLGAITGMLSGAGTREPVPIATAEWIEFDFIYPGGHKENVVREIFDRVGAARRATTQNLRADEVRKRIATKNAFDVTEAVFDLFITTGRINVLHLSNVVEDPPFTETETPEVRAGLRRFNITFAAASDALIPRLEQRYEDRILFYSDSPRVLIAELSAGSGLPRLSLDLRRDNARAVATGFRREDVFFARILRGVVDGTLERILTEYVTADAREKGKWDPVMSTSVLFERAEAEHVPTLLLNRKTGRVDAGLPEDVLARIRNEVEGRYLVVAPQRQITVGKESRFAWWRIRTTTGETTAVTDDGLHGTVTVGYVQRMNQTTKETTILVLYRSGMIKAFTFAGTGGMGSYQLFRFIAFLQRLGIPEMANIPLH